MALSLAVRGFPTTLSFGGYCDLEPIYKDDFTAANASFIYNYVGVDGSGDLDRNLMEDRRTNQTILASRELSQATGSSVLPVMVAITVNAESGDLERNLHAEEELYHGFSNLILALQTATQFDAQGKSSNAPAAFVVNPYFLGAAQQLKLPPTYGAPVRAALESAIRFRNVNARSPIEATNDLQGYVFAVNWLFATVAPQVPYGWQVNIFGTGSARWVWDESATEPTSVAAETAAYIQSLGVASNPLYKPDFVAVDRFAADDFTNVAISSGYCWSPREWTRYFAFVQRLHEVLVLPIMLFQIPASRIPNVHENVDKPGEEHWGTGGTQIFGDSRIGTKIRNINEKILALKIQYPYETTVKESFRSAEPFDLSEPTFPKFPGYGIFAVALGSSQSTGVLSSIGHDSAWVRQQMHAYSKSPVPLSPGGLHLSL